MLIRQHAYFVIFSHVVHPDVVSDRLGVRADDTMVMGSRSQSPLRPAFHKWMISCLPPKRVDEQLEEIVQRLTPIQRQIGRLVDELVASEGDDAGSELMVVRYFNDPDGIDEVRRIASGLVSLSG